LKINIERVKISLRNKGKNFYDVYDDDLKSNIGVVELFIDDNYWLNKIEVFGDCQRKGYGSEIVKYLTENHFPFKISLSSKTAHYHNHNAKNSNDTRCLTSDGFHLVKKCFESGILKRHNFSFPYPSDILPDYKTNCFLDSFFSNILNFINTFNKLFQSNNN